MNERQYLISILLTAREQVSQAAKKAVQALDGVTESQNKMSESAKISAKAIQEQRAALQQIQEARIREKRGIDEEAASLRNNARQRRENVSDLREQARQTRESARALYEERDAARAAQTASLREAASLAKLADERQQQIGAIDKTTKRLISQAEAARRMADTNRRLADSYQQTISSIERNATSFERSASASERAAKIDEAAASKREIAATKVARSISTVVSRISRLDLQYEKLTSSANNASRSNTRFGAALERIGLGSRGAASNLRGLNAEFQGLLLAAVIKYAQSLVSVLVTLAAQLFAVAAAATQAAAGLGAALGAGMAQAIPVVGVLAATFGRLADILKAVKLQNQQQLTATHDAAAAARRQTTAADQIRSAEERVADAHRNTARAVQGLAQARSDAAREEVEAQRSVTEAQQDASRNIVQAQRQITEERKDAIRTVQDLIAAEEDAFQQLEQARSGLESAVRRGDVAGAVQAEIDVRRAQTGLSRARQDAAPVRARGVEGVEAVQQAEERLADIRRQSVREIATAERRLADVRRSNERQVASASEQVADARRQETQATQDLARTRVQAKENLQSETAAVDKLTDSLNRLTPAERRLYDRILALQALYRRVSRPITDIIVGAFSDVVDRTISVLRDPRILRGFRNIAVEIAASIRTVTGEATGGRSRSAFELLSAEAARNIPIATRIAVNLFRTLRNIILAALPAFRLLLRYVETYSKRASIATENSSGLANFFITGIKYANAFFKLGLSIARLFLTLAGRGGAAAEGIRTIDDLTGRIDGLTRKAEANAGAIREFFASTRAPLASLYEVIGALGKAIIEAFSPESVTSFADFLTQIIIPAVTNVIKVMGLLVTVFHEFLSLPGVSEVAQLAATFLLLAKGLTIIRLAVADIAGIIPAFMRALGLMSVAAEGAAAGFAALTPPGWIALAIAAIIAAIVLLNKQFHFLGPTLEWIKNAAIDTFHWVLQAAKDTVSWFSDVWTQGLLYWIRYPFIKFGEWLGGQGWFQWIVGAFKDVIGFFAGPAWNTLKAMIMLPFDAALVALKVVWGVIKTIVVVALDVLSGRFERIGPHLQQIWGGIWEGIKGTLRSALNTLIDMVNSAVDMINKISPFGDIGHIGKLADDTEEVAGRTETATGKIADGYDKVGDSAEKNTDRVGVAVDDMAAKVETAASAASDAYAALSADGRVSLKEIRDETDIQTARIAGSLGRNSWAGKQAMARNFRLAAEAVKEQMDAGKISTRRGMREIRGYLAQALELFGFTIKEARAEVRPGTRFDAGPEEGTRGPGRPVPTNAGGGMVSGLGGWPRDDHVVMDPYGRVTSLVSGNEGIVNPPQMERINQWGSIVKGLGLDNYGSLEELWGMRGGGVFGGHSSKLRRRAGGGFLQLPINFRPTHETGGMSGYPATDVFAPPGTRVGSPINGRVVKLSGSSGGPGGGGPFGYSIYISGGGRTYFLTHFGSRAVRLGQRVRRGQTIGTVADYPDRADHIHEGVHGGAMGVTGRDAAATMVAPPRIRTPRITGGGDVGRMVQLTLRAATAGANNLLGRAAVLAAQSSVPGGTASLGPSTLSIGSGSRGKVIFDYFRRRGFSNAQAAAWVGNFQQESGLNPGAIQSGGPGRGLAQWGGGRFNALQAFAQSRGTSWTNMQTQLDFVWRELRTTELRAYRGIKAAKDLASAVNAIGRLYERFGIQGNRLGPAQAAYNAFARRAKGGLLPGAQGGRAPRPVKGLPAPRQAAVKPASALTRISLGSVVEEINSIFDDIAKILESVARGPLKRSKDLGTRIARALDKLTKEDGVLDQIHQAVEKVATQGALRLQQRMFSVGRGGPQRGFLSEEEQARLSLETLQTTRGGLTQERESIQGGIAGAERSLVEAQRRKNKKGIAAAKAALENLRGRLDQNTVDLAQNAQDQVEAVEAFQQGLLNTVNSVAEGQNDAIDRQQRILRAMGQSMDPNRVLDQQMGVMRQQIGGLQNVLNQALRTGNLDLATQVREQINELNVQIAEAVAQQFQNSIDAVNNEAARANARLDRAARRAQIGQTNFAALQGVLEQRQGVLQNQRAGLVGLLNQAAGAGNMEQWAELADQIDELDTTLAENTQAIRDNTDAAFNARTEQINERFGFSQTVLTGAQGFFQALTQRTGIDTLPQQITALQGMAGALQTQQQGLLQQLASLTGRSGVGLSGQDLVNWLVTIATGPTFDSIMASLDPTQQQSFKDLVGALLNNVSAVEQNTQAIGDLTGNNGQSFSSSFWTAFRTAVFTGAGGLLPGYQALVPGGGASTMIAGATSLMTAPSLTSTSSSHASSTGGDTYNVNVTTPTQVLNPTDVGRQLAFYRKTRGR